MKMLSCAASMASAMAANAGPASWIIDRWRARATFQQVAPGARIGIDVGLRPVARGQGEGPIVGGACSTSQGPRLFFLAKHARTARGRDGGPEPGPLGPGPARARGGCHREARAWRWVCRGVEGAGRQAAQRGG